jgi:fructose transport system ATP-binding protein
VTEAILQARGLVKSYGRVTAIAGADFDLLPGEILAVVGDNGAGKSSLIKTLSGALIPDAGEIRIGGELVHFHGPLDARRHGIETLYQDLALAPAQDIATNLFLGRERRKPGLLGQVFRLLDTRSMREEAQRVLDELAIGVKSMQQPVETLSGGQRQGVAVARAAAFGTKVVIMDEPTAALGVAESAKVIDLVRRIKDRGIPVVLISHNMPQVFEIADRVHVHRLGRRVGVVSPKTTTMNEVVGLITGALRVDADGRVEEVPHDATASSGSA